MARRNRASGYVSLRGWPLALLLIGACAVDNAGLGKDGGGPGSAGAGGAAGATGAAGAIAGTGGGGGPISIGGAGGDGGDGARGGSGGASGTGAGGTAGGAGGGQSGDGGGGGGGAAGAGAAGSAGGEAGGGGGGGGTGGGEAGAAGSGAGGAAGGGGAGTAGTGGAAGAGGLGGGAGEGGRGGTGGAGGGCVACPACTRCTSSGCTLDAASLWKIRCIGATIAQTKPNGDPWDQAFGGAAAPDPQCAFWLGNSLAAQTSVLSNTFAPAWNESITPTSRFSAALLSSQSSPWSIRVTDDDQPGGADAVCSVSPTLDMAAFLSGSATFAAGSCATLQIGLECVSP